MPNRIDFFQSEQTQPALPAATVSVLLDGMLCPVLEPIEIVRGGWPEFSRARLAYNPAAFTAACPDNAENLQTEFATGKTVCIRQYFNGIPPGAATFSFPVFYGQIEEIETTVGAEGEKVEITAVDFSANLKRISVYGQRVAKGEGEGVFLAGLDTIFNPDSKPNANPSPIAVGGKSYTSFLRRAITKQIVELC